MKARHAFFYAVGLIMVFAIAWAGVSWAQGVRRLGGGLTESAADALYLRLDANNDPITGTLELAPAAVLDARGSITNLSVAALKFFDAQGIFINNAVSEEGSGPFEVDDVDGFRVSNGNLFVGGGQIEVTGTTPAFFSCGTSPSIVGSDAAGIITVGTGTITLCLIDFATTYTNAPSCVVSGDSTTLDYAVNTSMTQLSVSTGSTMASNVLNYICVGL